MLHNFMPNSSHVDPDSAGPTITPHQSTLVEWERSKVLHHLPLRLTPLIVVFPAIEGEQNYKVGYQIFAENIDRPAEGSITLHVLSGRTNVSHP
jgi:hypothetical protein